MATRHRRQFGRCLSSFNTFRLSAQARCVFRVTRPETLTALKSFSPTYARPPLLLGEGSNVLFLDDYDGLVLINRILGTTVVEETEASVHLAVGGGENWHSLVEWVNDHGYYGLENLSMIPGSVGATPVQNIGAYGVELSSVLRGVDAIHMETAEAVYFDRAACQLAYRDSFFKSVQGKQWLITHVHFQLSKKPTFQLHYAGLSDLQSQADAGTLTAQHVSDRVNQLRQSKLPNPIYLPNAGSFFRNPVVTEDELERLRTMHDGLVCFQVGKSWKLSAAWMLDKMGWKGRRRGDAGVYENHALVLVNHGEATGREIWTLASDMKDSVEQRFSVTLVPEVRSID